MQPDFRPPMQPDFRPTMKPDFRPTMQPDFRPPMQPDFSEQISFMIETFLSIDAKHVQLYINSNFFTIQVFTVRILIESPLLHIISILSR